MSLTQGRNLFLEFSFHRYAWSRWVLSHNFGSNFNAACARVTQRHRSIYAKKASDIEP